MNSFQIHRFTDVDKICIANIFLSIHIGIKTVKNWIVLQSWFEEDGVQTLRKTKSEEKVFFPTVTTSKTKEYPRVGIFFFLEGDIFIMVQTLLFWRSLKIRFALKCVPGPCTIH